MDAAFDLIHQMDWILTRQKFKLLCQKSPRSFYVAVTADGEVAATMSCCATGSDDDFVLGNVVVKEKFRGKGLGRQLISDSLSTFHHKSVQLLAVDGVDQFYLKLGFSYCEPNHVCTYMTVNHDVLNTRAQNCEQSVTIKPLADTSFTVDDLVTYDRTIRGYEVSDFLEVVNECESLLVATDMQSKSIVGYVGAFMKKDNLILDGLYADSDNVSVLLFRSVLSHFKTCARVRMQMFASNQFLLQFGQVTYTEEYRRFFTGRKLTNRALEKRIYSATDSDYTV